MNIRSIRFFLLLVLALLTFSQATVAAERTPQEKFADATSLMNSRKFAEALPILEDLRDTYPTATVYWNLGLSAAAVGQNKEALDSWLAYRKVMPGNWQGRAKLVQTYQALGDIPARDRERADLVALWQGGTDAQLSAQELFCREQFVQDGRKVMVLEYFNPSGPKMLIYSFMVLNDSGQPDFKISLGSYDTTNQVALELGERPKDKRIYHLDLYRANLHETYGMYLGQPAYDDIRHVVADVLSGKAKAMSGSVMPSKPAQ